MATRRFPEPQDESEVDPTEDNDQRLPSVDDEPPDPPKGAAATPIATTAKNVRCPRCKWKPDGRPLWRCTDCHIRFDTFATHATCPKCSRTWSWTQCIACKQYVDHELWYVDDVDRA